MARETKAEREERQRLEQERENAENAEFLAQLPLTVFDLMVRAEKRHDVTYSVHNTDGLRRVEFKFDADHIEQHYKSEYIVYIQDNYTWQLRDSVDNVVLEFEQREAAEREAARERVIAQEAYDGLSPEQRKALKLNHRP